MHPSNSPVIYLVYANTPMGLCTHENVLWAVLWCLGGGGDVFINIYFYVVWSNRSILQKTSAVIICCWQYHDCFFSYVSRYIHFQTRLAKKRWLNNLFSIAGMGFHVIILHTIATTSLPFKISKPLETSYKNFLIPSKEFRLISKLFFFPRP